MEILLAHSTSMMGYSGRGENAVPMHYLEVWFTCLTLVYGPKLANGF